MEETKKEAIRILSSCALSYETELANKNLLFVFVKKSGKTGVFETTFLNSNFLHLTGVISSVEPINFYNKCLNSKLTDKDIYFKKDGTTWRKLRILPRFVSKNLSANMLGRFSETGMRLYTERVVGQVNGTMGFVYDSNRKIFIPNTLLEEDVRNLSNNIYRIIFSFRKNIGDQKYSEVVYTAKKLKLDRIKLVLPSHLDYLKSYFISPVKSNSLDTPND